ncbi:MAG: hypothetical protein ACK4ZW_11795 [Blastomonas sp.]
MTTPDFAHLVDVSPREAWAHEAHSFTPWLADNLPRLSDAIGIPLELTGREVGVGRYSADILATNPQDGSMVLIENQLEWSDHTHMGQILTYLAGLEAQVVIWLAPQFREEHLSALRWLNQHTDERFSFFAVRLRVVRIADSPYAPLFDVLEKPNSWERSLQKTARAASEPTADGLRRSAFWEQYALLDPLVVQDHNIAKGAARWRLLGDTGVVISRWMSKKQVGLFYRGGRGADYGEMGNRLRTFQAQLEAATGAPMGEDRYLFSKLGPAVSDDPTTWPAAIAWLIAETERYTAAIESVMQEETI